MQLRAENIHHHIEKGFNEVYSKLYSNGEKRLVHGIDHTGSAALAVWVLVNFRRVYGDPKALALTEEDVFYLQIAALYHDAARDGDGEDIWDDASALYCYEVLLNEGLSSDRAKHYAEAIANKDFKGTKHCINIETKTMEKIDMDMDEKPIEWQLIHDVDCMEIIRTPIQEFKGSCLDTPNFFAHNDAALTTFGVLLSEYKGFIYARGDCPHRSNQDALKEYFSQADLGPKVLALWQESFPTLYAFYHAGQCLTKIPDIENLHGLTEEEKELRSAMQRGEVLMRSVVYPSGLNGKAQKNEGKYPSMAAIEIHKMSRNDISKGSNPARSASIATGFIGSRFYEGVGLLYRTNFNKIISIDSGDIGSGNGAKKDKRNLPKLAPEIAKNQTRDLVNTHKISEVRTGDFFHPEFLTDMQASDCLGFFYSEDAVTDNGRETFHERYITLLQALFLQGEALRMKGKTLPVYFYSTTGKPAKEYIFNEEKIVRIWQEVCFNHLNYQGDYQLKKLCFHDNKEEAIEALKKDASALDLFTYNAGRQSADKYYPPHLIAKINAVLEKIIEQKRNEIYEKIKDDFKNKKEDLSWFFSHIDIIALFAQECIDEALIEQLGKVMAKDDPDISLDKSLDLKQLGMYAAYEVFRPLALYTLLAQHCRHLTEYEERVLNWKKKVQNFYQNNLLIRKEGHSDERYLNQLFASAFYADAFDDAECARKIQALVASCLSTIQSLECIDYLLKAIKFVQLDTQTIQNLIEGCFKCFNYSPKDYTKEFEGLAKLYNGLSEANKMDAGIIAVFRAQIQNFIQHYIVYQFASSKQFSSFMQLLQEIDPSSADAFAKKEWQRMQAEGRPQAFKEIALIKNIHWSVASIDKFDFNAAFEPYRITEFLLAYTAKPTTQCLDMLIKTLHYPISALHNLFLCRSHSESLRKEHFMRLFKNLEQVLISIMKYKLTEHQKNELQAIFERYYFIDKIKEPVRLTITNTLFILSFYARTLFGPVPKHLFAHLMQIYLHVSFHEPQTKEAIYAEAQALELSQEDRDTLGTLHSVLEEDPARLAELLIQNKLVHYFNFTQLMQIFQDNKEALIAYFEENPMFFSEFIQRLHFNGDRTQYAAFTDEPRLKALFGRCLLMDKALIPFCLHQSFLSTGTINEEKLALYQCIEESLKQDDHAPADVKETLVSFLEEQGTPSFSVLNACCRLFKVYDLGTIPKALYTARLHQFFSLLIKDKNEAEVLYNDFLALPLTEEDNAFLVTAIKPLLDSEAQDIPDLLLNPIFLPFLDLNHFIQMKESVTFSHFYSVCLKDAAALQKLLTGEKRHPIFYQNEKSKSLVYLFDAKERKWVEHALTEHSFAFTLLSSYGLNLNETKLHAINDFVELPQAFLKEIFEKYHMLRLKLDGHFADNPEYFMQLLKQNKHPCERKNIVKLFPSTEKVMAEAENKPNLMPPQTEETRAQDLPLERADLPELQSEKDDGAQPVLEEVIEEPVSRNVENAPEKRMKQKGKKRAPMPQALLHAIFVRIEALSSSDIACIKDIVDAADTNKKELLQSYPEAIKTFYTDFQSLFDMVGGQEFLGGDTAQTKLTCLISEEDITMELAFRLEYLSLFAQTLSQYGKGEEVAKHGLNGSNLALLSAVVEQSDLFKKYVKERAGRIAAWVSSVVSTGLGFAGGLVLGTFMFPGVGTLLGGLLGASFGLGLHLTGIGFFELGAEFIQVATSYILWSVGLAMAGASLGALIGSLLPGVGTVVGAILGASLGLSIALFGAVLAYCVGKCVHQCSVDGDRSVPQPEEDSNYRHSGQELTHVVQKGFFVVHKPEQSRKVVCEKGHEEIAAYDSERTEISKFHQIA